ncbi:MAG: hypothetical protein OEZ01_09610 [Candidatus Heimdallarchaeota archaeon]|nr:hypothetical protein [Candidatus Heimdallarchaeota archaeon]MDH5646253.1 hypothetical protein [Candidatus Heimdallarchaeota archaeon]
MNSVFLTFSPIATILLSDHGEILNIYPELDDMVIQSLKDANYTFSTDSNSLKELLKKHQIASKLEINHPILRDWRINRYEYLLEKTGLISDINTYREKLRMEGLHQTILQVKNSYGKRDELVSQIILSIDDIQKNINLSDNRLRELYSLHFPELIDYIANPLTLAKIIAKSRVRTNITVDLLQSYNIPEEKRNKIITGISDTLGADLSDQDLEPLIEYANLIILLNEKKSKLEAWVDKNMETIAPNVTAVAGANTGARLIASFGSLHKLAMSSSSKIQVIGAEKALYSYIRSGGSPPKHGIIYQIAEINNAPYWIRGKLSRIYASKIAIASRLDLFGGEYLGKKMRENIRILEEKLREKYPNPPNRSNNEEEKR